MSLSGMSSREKSEFIHTLVVRLDHPKEILFLPNLDDESH
jgi:hypothetical protein